MKKEIFSFIKLNKFFLIFLFLLFGIFYWLSFIYPLVFDDTGYSHSNINNIGFQHLKLPPVWWTMKGSYNKHGRVGSMFIYILIHLPYLMALLSSVSILCLFGLFPYSICSIHKETRNNQFNIQNFLLCFSLIALVSLFFPWYFYSYNDFFNRTMFVTYALPVIGFVGTCIFIWYQIMILKPIPTNCLSAVLLLLGGIIISISSELINIYGLGMIFGIFFLSVVRYRTFPKLSISNIFLLSGIFIGSLIVFTSKGFLKGITGTQGRIRDGSSWLIMTEIMPLSLLFIIMITIVYTTLYYIYYKRKSSTKDNAIIHKFFKKHLTLLYRLSKQRTNEQEEFIYRSLYLFLVWCGFIIILYIAKIPYFRTMIVGATMLPLVYLFLLGLSKLLVNITIPRYFLILPITIIMYSIYVTIYNIDLMNKIINDFQKQIIIAQETNTDLIVPVYDAPFKHIYIKSGDTYIFTSEMGLEGQLGHAHQGTTKEKQIEGMRLFYHTLSLNAPMPVGWKLFFYQYSGQVSSNQTITNKY